MYLLSIDMTVEGTTKCQNVSNIGIVEAYRSKQPSGDENSTNWSS